MEFRDVKTNILDKYNDNFTFEELGKLAIDYSDGIIEATNDVNEPLLNYAKQSNLPILEYSGNDYIDSYEDFYNLISKTE